MPAIEGIFALFFARIPIKEWVYDKKWTRKPFWT
jgi:hypothetical protein